MNETLHVCWDACCSMESVEWCHLTDLLSRCWAAGRYVSPHWLAIRDGGFTTEKPAKNVKREMRQIFKQSRWTLSRCQDLFCDVFIVVRGVVAVADHPRLQDCAMIKIDSAGRAPREDRAHQPGQGAGQHDTDNRFILNDLTQTG